MATQKNNVSLAELAKKNILHPQTSISILESDGPRIIEGGKGVYVRDIHGHQVIDGAAGLWCVNVGYGHEELAKAMADSALELGYYHNFTANDTIPVIELSDHLIEMSPASLKKVFFGCSGSDANDTIVKIVWHYNVLLGRPEKKKIISRFNAYHGTSISSASLTGIPAFHKAMHLPIDGIIHLPEYPYYYRYGKDGESEEEYGLRCAHDLETRILAEGPETVAAFIAEPIMGAGGVVTPPKGYFEAVQHILKKYDILMIADEVICGYGRLGKNFGSDVYNIQPDLMATAKGITSGYFPLSVTYLSDEIYDVLRIGSQTLGSFFHGYTYTGHPIGAAVALKNLEIMRRDKLKDNAAHVGAYLKAGLVEALGGHPHVGEVRGEGLLIGIQLIADKATKRFFDPARKIAARVAGNCYAKGAIVRPLPSVSTLALSPPLILTNAEADQLIAIIKDGIHETLGKLTEDDLTPAI